MKQASVVLLSGGMDSAANLALCAEQDQPVLALTADYGQRAFEPELRAACALSVYYGVRHERLDLRWLGALGGSALTSRSSEPPDVAPALLDDASATRASAKAVWVPNRNGVLIGAAAAYAERLGAARVVVGFNAEEAATFADNTREFLDRATAALAYSTATGIAVHCYTTALDKRQIVVKLRGLPRPFPFDRVWSCYREGPVPCGACESCRRLARALGALE